MTEFYSTEIGTIELSVPKFNQTDFLQYRCLYLSDVEGFHLGFLAPNFELGLLLRLSETQDQLPSSLFIACVTGRDEQATFYRGFGDIYRARYNEALVWQALHHKYILPLIGIDRENFPSFCSVSPWMKHGTILKYLGEHRQHLNVDKLILQIAEGLGYLHSQNVVHGDLRGYNIWCRTMGVYVWRTSVFQPSAKPTPQRASSGARATAPEARGGLHQSYHPTEFECEKFVRTTAIDVYAVACVCLEVRDGERPGRPETMSDVLWTVVNAAWA
ncbi:kinase-like domain-containing protein [Mycena leptocephala]|nr:kinase-like domain-containing protein [Mycena leptocephala]